MNKWIAGLFATVLVAGVAKADVGAPAPSAKDLEKVVEEVNFVETAKAGVVLSGYVDVGYIYNFNGTNGGTRRAPADSRAKGDFNVNAVKLTLEKPLTDANEFQAGFRVDLMTGEDVSNTLGGNAGPALLGESNGLLVEQAYVAVRAPYGNGIDIKAGKFVTWLGYEVIERPANLNITYGNLFQNAIPLYHTGVSAEYAFNDIVDGGIAITNGFNNDSSATVGGAEDGYAVQAKLNITNPGGNANWYNALYYGFGAQSAPGSNSDTVIYDTWGNWAPTAFDDKLLLGLNANIGNHSDNTWWGVAAYAKYQFTDIFSLAGRADYLHGDTDAAGFNAPAGPFAGGNGHTDTWSYTLTAGFDLLENLLVRAEYRLDIDGDFAIGSNNLHTIALQAVYTF